MHWCSLGLAGDGTVRWQHDSLPSACCSSRADGPLRWQLAWPSHVVCPCCLLTEHGMCMQQTFCAQSGGQHERLSSAWDPLGLSALPCHRVKTSAWASVGVGLELEF